MTGTNSPSKHAASCELSRLLASMRGTTLKLNKLHRLLEKDICYSSEDIKRLIYNELRHFTPRGAALDPC